MAKNDETVTAAVEAPAEGEEQKKVASEPESGHKTPTTAAGPNPAGTSINLPDLARDMNRPTEASAGIDLLKDVELNVKIELGRAKMYVEDVLKLAEGSVVELDKLAGDPVDIFVNERLVARGEVLVLNENFCVRVNQIVSDVV